METRVLTLFDDEDFYPKEEPKKKPKKEPVAKTIESINVTQAAEIQETTFPSEIKEEDTIQAHEVQEPESGGVIPEEEGHIAQVPEMKQETFNHLKEGIPAEEPAEQVGMDASTTIIDEPKNKLPEEEEHVENITADAEGEPLPDVTEDEEHESRANADDEELNRQILTELVQTDYASLIHRDYPFDMSNASVIGKNVVTSSQEDTPQDESHEDDNEVFEDIVPLPEWKLDKKYYTIGEVAQLFAVNTSHIRFWTNEFKLKPRTTRKGDRLYSPKDIAELRLIHHLVKEKKHTIKGAREKLKAEKNDVHKKLDLKDSLVNLRDTLLKIKEQL